MNRLDYNAIERLRSLPSEIQAIKFAHDNGYIISEANNFPPMRRFYQEAQHIDLLVYSPKETPGKTRMVGIDVKNHRNNEYENLFLETQTRKDKKTGKRYPSWAFCNLMNGADNAKHNRYLLDVWNKKGDISFTELIQKNELINETETEEKNEDRIIEFFAKHRELLNHDMMLYAYNDIDEELLRTGGIILENRKKDVDIKSTGVKALIIDWTVWDQKHVRRRYWWDETGNMWKNENFGKGKISLMHNYNITANNINGVYQTAYGIEKRENEKIERFRESQKNGLSAEIIKRILGPSKKSLTLDEYSDIVSIEIDKLEDQRQELLKRIKERYE